MEKYELLKAYVVTLKSQQKVKDFHYIYIIIDFVFKDFFIFLFFIFFYFFIFYESVNIIKESKKNTLCPKGLQRHG